MNPQDTAVVAAAKAPTELTDEELARKLAQEWGTDSDEAYAWSLIKKR